MWIRIGKLMSTINERRDNTRGPAGTPRQPQGIIKGPTDTPGYLIHPIHLRHKMDTSLKILTKSTGEETDNWKKSCIFT